MNKIYIYEIYQYIIEMRKIIENSKKKINPIMINFRHYNREYSRKFKAI